MSTRYFKNLHQLQFHFTAAFKLLPGYMREGKAKPVQQQLFCFEARRIFGSFYPLDAVSAEIGQKGSYSLTYAKKWEKSFTKNDIQALKTYAKWVNYLADKIGVDK